MKDIPQLKLDKTKIKIGNKIEDSVADEIEYWQNTTVKERLQHIEKLRRLNYGTGAVLVCRKLLMNIGVAQGAKAGGKFYKVCRISC